MKGTSGSLDYQRRYFDGHARERRIGLGDTRCVRRHFDRTIAPLGLRPGARVVELGCGMGRFTRLLLESGFDVTALDLSPYLIDRMRQKFAGVDRLRPIVGRSDEVQTLTGGPFDAVLGFFFLHHLTEFDGTFAAARAVLASGGRVAFCEPNAFNPLVYVQVTVTPRMSWKGEPSIPQMRPSVIFPSLRRSGFTNLATDLYGALPPVVSNTAPGAALERALEWLPPLRPLSAYRIFRGSVSR
jgi:SAM-dependent methyltransferase